MSEKELRATLEWEGKKVEFEGSFEEVWKSINRFLVATNPKIMSLSDLLIKIDFSELLAKLKGIIHLDKDVGPVVSIGIDSRLGDTERIVLVLVARRIANAVGYLKEETMEVEEVEKESKSKNAGVLLSQLVSQKVVQNVAEPGKKGAYRVTDYGTQWFVSKAMPKLVESQ
jgi:hypothetical protein